MFLSSAHNNQSSVKVIIAVNVTSINVTCLDNGLEILLPESKLKTLPELSTVEIPLTTAADTCCLEFK